MILCVWFCLSFLSNRLNSSFTYLKVYIDVPGIWSLSLLLEEEISLLPLIVSELVSECYDFWRPEIVHHRTIMSSFQ